MRKSRLPGSNSRPNVSEGYEVPLSYRGDIIYTNLFSDNVCTVHQFITEIKMFSDNVRTVPTVVTVSSESAREKEGEH